MGPMMLLDDATGLTARIADYKRLKGNAGAAKEFETRATQFVEVADKLDRVADSIENIVTAGIPLPFVPKDGVALASKASALRALVKEDAAKLNDPPFNIKYDFVDRLIGICKAADEQMLASWKTYVASQTQIASSDVLTALGSVPQYKPVVARILTVKSQVAVISQGVPHDPKGSVALLTTLMKSYHAAWAEMTAEGMPPAVIEFLRDAASGGAMLSQLTQEVHVWLSGRNLLGVFRIRI